ncbi:10182_t:CDS:2, partial [Gigaspora margarita]
MTQLLVFRSQSSLSCYIKNTLKYKVLTLQELLEKESDSSSKNKDENDSNSNDKIQEPDQKFQELIQLFISKGRLGSTKMFYRNEKFGDKFLDLVAATGLISSVNHKEIKTAVEESTNNALCAACKE